MSMNIIIVSLGDHHKFVIRDEADSGFHFY